MSSTDWTAISDGSGAYAVVSDGTAPSSTHVAKITAGVMMFQNLTTGTAKDSRITVWSQQTNANNTSLYLALRCQNTTYLSAPATMFYTRINGSSSTTVSAQIFAVVNGVSTPLITVQPDSLNGNPLHTWQRWQFSAFNFGTDIILRVCQWNGSAFISIVDVFAPIASFGALDAAGRGRFGGQSAFGTEFHYLDDAIFSSIA